MSKLIAVATALQSMMAAACPTYTVTTQPDFDWEGRAVIYFNGSDKPAEAWFAGSYLIERVSGQGRWDYYLICPETRRRNYLIKYPDGDGDPYLERLETAWPC
jgi:hypothetical protein